MPTTLGDGPIIGGDEVLTQEENELITKVGPGTQMGETLRRHWNPALQSWELPGPDCDPMRLRLLSEDLVAFLCLLFDVG